MFTSRWIEDWETNNNGVFLKLIERIIIIIKIVVVFMYILYKKFKKMYPNFFRDTVGADVNEKRRYK